MSAKPAGRAHVRRAVAYASLALAALGWAVAAWAWAALGHDAGIEAVFVMALTVACTFSITYAVAVVMPDQARIYALGFRDGCAFAEERVAPEPTRLRSVR